MHRPPRSFFFNDTATTEIYTLSLHDALPISRQCPEATGLGRPPARTLADDTRRPRRQRAGPRPWRSKRSGQPSQRGTVRSEEHTSELQSRSDVVCRLLLEKKSAFPFLRRRRV